MNIKQFAQQLRHAADILDTLMDVDRPTKKETAKTAKAIIKDLAVAKKPHWTQTKKGRKRMSQLSKKAWADKKNS